MSIPEEEYEPCLGMECPGHGSCSFGSTVSGKWTTVHYVFRLCAQSIQHPEAALLRYMNAKVSAFLPVLFKPVGHKIRLNLAVDFMSNEPKGNRHPYEWREMSNHQVSSKDSHIRSSHLSISKTADLTHASVSASMLSDLLKSYHFVR